MNEMWGSDGLEPSCPFCTSDAVVHANKSGNWWCNNCQSEFDDDGEVVVEDDDNL